MLKINRRTRRLVPNDRRPIVVTLYPEDGAMGPSIGLREPRQRASSEKRIEIARLFVMLTRIAVDSRRRVKRGRLGR